MTGSTDLPHWTDPPTGEVPKILADPAGEPDDDLDAWNALGSHGTRWRDESDDWSDMDEIGELGADVAPEGILDPTRAEHSDIYSFDEDFERVEAERTGQHQVTPAFDEFEDEPEYGDEPVAARSTGPARHTRASTATRGTLPGRQVGTSSRGSDDLASRVVVGVGLVVLLTICYAIGSKALLLLATAVTVAAAAEAYSMLQRSGFRPATLLGLVATTGLMFGAYWKGAAAIPLVAILVFAGSMLWYLLRIVDARPLANVAVTTMTFVWVAALGSYGPVMLRVHDGKGLFLGTVLVAVFADIAAFVVGRWVGSRPMAADVSPSKTVEGFLGGLVAALIVGAAVGKWVSPWGGMKHGLLLGLIVGLVAPIGDLFESMIKRDLGIKDSGTALLGHGGLLDRFDSVLLALPVSYYLATIILHNVVR